MIKKSILLFILLQLPIHLHGMLRPRNAEIVYRNTMRGLTSVVKPVYDHWDDGGMQDLRLFVSIPLFFCGADPFGDKKNDWRSLLFLLAGVVICPPVKR